MSNFSSITFNLAFINTTLIKMILKKSPINYLLLNPMDTYLPPIPSNFWWHLAQLNIIFSLEVYTYVTFFFQFSCWLLLLWILLNCSLGNILLPILSFFLGRSNSHQFAARTIVMTQISNPIPLLWALNLLDISKLYHLKCLTILFYLPFTFIPVNRLHLSNLKPDNPDSSLLTSTFNSSASSIDDVSK